jgi:hypothetical protein
MSSNPSGHGTSGDQHNSRPHAVIPEPLRKILSAIHAREERLGAIVATPFTYSVVSQRAMNQQTDELLASGAMSSVDLNTPAGPSRVVSPSAVVSRELIRTVLYNNARPLILIRTLRQVSSRSIAHLLRASRLAVADNDFLVAFICYRSCLEHVAHVAMIEKELAKLTPEVNHPAAVKFLNSATEVLAKKLYSTRLAWAKIKDATTLERLIMEEELSYEAGPERIDTTAKSCLAGIDLLNKRVKGARACYEILCEFAHPNVGNLLVFTLSATPRVDTGGILWIDKTLGDGAPKELLTELGFLVERVLGVVVASLDELHDRLLPALNAVELPLQLALESLCRTVLRKNGDLFDGYAPCPCQSGKKTRFCCGKR